MADNTTTGTPGGSAMGGSSSGISTKPGNGGLGTGAAPSLAQTAQEYAGKVSEAATQAKDYVSDKVGVVGEKIKDLDLAEVSENAKQYARRNPGQAILISAGIGLLLGILVRGRR